MANRYAQTFRASHWIGTRNILTRLSQHKTPAVNGRWQLTKLKQVIARIEGKEKP
jgi:hypothetical protein